MENNWYPENPLCIDGPSIARPIHPGCLPVAAALKECAGLLFKEFALVVLNENGEENVYTSAALTPHQRRIFTDRFKVDFRSSVREALARESGQGSLKDHLHNEHHDGRSNISDSLPAERIRRHSQLQLTPTCFDSAIDGKRKRAISSPSCDSYPDRHSIATPTRKTRRLVISDEGGVESFYLVRFKEMQQSACKIMGKAFVKFVEPKKQSHYPYSKGDIAAPPWWPDTKGNRSVRHKEPDHLLKPERIRLLVHILRMVAGPRNKQCAAVQNLDLSVKKLEEATMKSMSSWFNDSEHTENSLKEVLLKGIFKVAKAEERYKKREIDDTTCIFVTYDIRYRVDDPDDDEPGEDIEEVDESHQACLVPVPSSTPGPSFSPVTMIPNRPPPQPNDFYGMHNTQFRPNIQNQSDNHIPYDNGPYPSSGLPPQGVADFDLSRRALPSFTSYPQQRNTYDWDNGTVSRDPTSTSTSSQPSMPHTTSYGFPLPSSEHQFETSGYLPQPSLPRAYFQG